jgi:hypothetical protein
MPELTEEEITRLDKLGKRKTSWTIMERRRVAAAYKRCRSIRRIKAISTITKKSYETIRAMLIRADLYYQQEPGGTDG